MDALAQYDSDSDDSGDEKGVQAKAATVPVAAKAKFAPQVAAPNRRPSAPAKGGFSLALSLAGRNGKRKGNLFVKKSLGDNRAGASGVGGGDSEDSDDDDWDPAEMARRRKAAAAAAAARKKGGPGKGPGPAMNRRSKLLSLLPKPENGGGSLDVSAEDALRPSSSSSSASLAALRTANREEPSAEAEGDSTKQGSLQKERQQADRHCQQQQKEEEQTNSRKRKRPFTWGSVKAKAKASRTSGGTWQQVTDKASGRPYYYNSVTGVTAWDLPEGATARSASVALPASATGGRSSGAPLTAKQRRALEARLAAGAGPGKAGGGVTLNALIPEGADVSVMTMDKNLEDQWMYREEAEEAEALSKDDPSINVQAEFYNPTAGGFTSTAKVGQTARRKNQINSIAAKTLRTRAELSMRRGAAKANKAATRGKYGW